MYTIRCLLAAALFAISSLVTPASATAFGTDHSDLWWITSESGWGVQFVQRGSIIFITLFVYDAANNPTWYTATLTYAGNLVWSGDLIATNGPWFGAVPFDPGAVTRRKVGTMTWAAIDVNDGTLTYSVDGVNAIKRLTRQFIALDNFGARYAGAIHQDSTACFNPVNNGTVEQKGVLAATQNGTAFTLNGSYETGPSCTYSGTLSQAGQMGQVFGSYNCSNGDFGNFHLAEMQITESGLTGRFSATSAALGCSTTGWLGGMRSTTF